MSYRSRSNDGIDLVTLIKGLAVAFVAIFILSLGNPLRIVDSGERLVLKHFGDASSVLGPGLHVVIPFVDSTSHYDIRIQKKSTPIEAQTFDIQQLTGIITANLQVDPDQLLRFYEEQGSLENTINTIVAPQIQESIKTTVAKFTAEKTVQERAALKAGFDAELTRRLQPYCLKVVDTAIEDVDFSQSYTDAVEAKQVEEQNVQLESFKAEQARIRGEAAAKQAAGEAEAIALKREALEKGGALVILDRAVKAWEANGSPVPNYLDAGNLVQLFKSVN